MGDLSAPPIAISRIEVRDDRIVVLVRWREGAAHDTDRALIEKVLERYPDLPNHSCVNERGAHFSAVMGKTPIPHLLEHMIISEMTRDKRTPPEALLCATSEWLSETEGLARLELSYRDDLVALAAIQKATASLNECLEAPGM